MNAPSLRPATTADIETIRQLAHEIWPAAYGHILSEKQLLYMLDRFYSAEALEQQMTVEGQQFLLLSHPEPIGFAAVGRVKNDLWKLHKLYLSPSFQGSGLGRFVLQEAENHAQQKGAQQMMLQVNRANRARHFYEKAGYHIQQEIDIPIGEGYFMNDFIMEKQLV